MGIVEQELAVFELPDNTECRIELNKNGRIHIHIGKVRFDQTPEEFAEFVAVVSEANNNLKEIKDIE